MSQHSPKNTHIGGKLIWKTPKTKIVYTVMKAAAAAKTASYHIEQGT